MNSNLSTLSKTAILLFISIAGFAQNSDWIQSAKHHLYDQGPAVQSKGSVEAQFESARAEFEKRWERFRTGKVFCRWTPHRPQQEIEEEFQRIFEERTLAWYASLKDPVREVHPDFAIAEELIAGDHVRVPNCVAFDYNKSCNYYNSSNINIEGLRFLAMEGTRSKDESGFFRLLLNSHASRLIRLTPSYDGAQKKCHPYWEGRMVMLSHGKWVLSVPRRDSFSVDLPYYVCDEWVDNQGTQPEILCNLIEQVREGYQPGEDLIAVHCSAGVGRTGTFIAAFALIQMAEEQLNLGRQLGEVELSIQEVVSKLSLQRFHMVGQKAQYVLLYRLLDLYFERKGLI